MIDCFRRVDGSVDFYRTWNEYSAGFGTVGSGTNFWAGNQLIAELTHYRGQTLKVELWDCNGGYAYENYPQFIVSHF